MSEPSIESKISELSAKVDSLIWGCKVGVVSLLALFSLINLLDTFAISLFRFIYNGSLGPDHPLPGLTLMFLDGQTLVTCLAVLWPLLGILAAFRIKRVSTSIIVPTCLLVIVIGQIVLNWLSLLMPMLSIPGGMSDSPH